MWIVTPDGTAAYRAETISTMLVEEITPESNDPATEHAIFLYFDSGDVANYSESARFAVYATGSKQAMENELYRLCAHLNSVEKPHG